MVSEVFLTTLSVSTFGFFLAILGVCYKSKCKTIDCCCIKIVRDVEGEEKIDEVTLQRNSLDTTPTSETLPIG
jgi:hypothetical protein